MIAELLQKHRAMCGPVIRDLHTDGVLKLDFTARNKALTEVDLKDTAAFDRWLSSVLKGRVGIGGYLEDRAVYHRSPHFGGEEARSVHLGIDVWTPASTPVYAPWAGTVHSFRDNQGFGNYGPTIILQHQLDNQPFYTLYGHLSRASLETLRVGEPVGKNELIGEVGPYPENGDWPPHLHLQLMTDMLGWVGDFPGVVAPSQRAKYAAICVDPWTLLHLA